MKTQMKFQKILALVSLITAALAVVLSLCFCSGVLNGIINYSSASAGRDKYGVDNLYIFSQGINNALVIMAIVFLLATVLLYIMGCNKRRNYYTTNYVAIGVYAAVAFAFVIFMIIVCAMCFVYMGEIDFAAWKAYEAEQEIGIGGELVYSHTQYYSRNCATMVLGILLSVVIIAEIVVWILNLIWKIKLMKGEKALLAQGVAQSTAEMEVA